MGRVHKWEFQFRPLPQVVIPSEAEVLTSFFLFDLEKKRTFSKRLKVFSLKEEKKG